jgi:1-phosphofructokinase
VVATLTPNPSLDLTYLLPAGADAGAEVQRALATTLEPSGKGVNVALALHAAGKDAVAVLPLAGATGRHLVELLDEAGLRHRTVDQAGQARVNTTVLRAGAPTTKYNAPGPALSPSAMRRLLGALLEACADVLVAERAEERWLVVCGSLPPQHDGPLQDRPQSDRPQGEVAQGDRPSGDGSGSGTARDLAGGLALQAVGVAHAVGARCALDVSGTALAGAIGSGADLLAPNVAELAEVDVDVRAAVASGRPDAVPAAVRALAARTRSQLLVSAGADGAYWTDGTELLHATGAPLKPVNTAGAGDALLAGWLAGAEEPAERLRRAVRWGRSACLAATTVDADPGGRDTGEVTVRRI